MQLISEENLGYCPGPRVSSSGILRELRHALRAGGFWMLVISSCLVAGAADTSPGQSRPALACFSRQSGLDRGGAGSFADQPLRPHFWTFKTGGAVRSSAVIGTDTVFIGSEDSHIYALNFADGKQVWAFKATAPVQALPLLLQ